jgi:glycerol-3-phosphate dehydrogenase
VTDDFPPFSAAARGRHLRDLAGETWDVLVVGGGITGAAAARDAAGRGLRVALVEARDLARGTSSRSSRLIHGGIRYLETFELRLVFEASAERRRLLELAPHLVHPLPFLFPVYRGEPVGFRKLQAGMWLYDGLALFRNIGRHRMLRPDDVLAEEPGLRADGLSGAARYHDAAVDDARLTVANARGAHEAGAAVVPYAEVVEVVRRDGRVEAARVRDVLDPAGAEMEVRALAVLNATGPWSDTLRRMADPAAAPRLRPTKGVHVMLPRARVGNRGAVIFRSRVDGRVMFVLPWGEFTYVGTTDTDYRGPPGEARAEPEDVRYLLDSANGIFPGARLTEADVLSTWAGVRPLLAPAKGADLTASATSREHEIWRDGTGLWNVAGGKLTTYRTMAEEVVDRLAKALRKERGVHSGISPTRFVPLPGTPDGPWEAFLSRVVEEAGALGLPDGTGEHLARAHGEEADAVLAAVRARPEDGRPVVEGLPYVWAEVAHAVHMEMALTLEDLLLRRMHVALEAADGGVAVAEAVARRMAAEPGIGWDEAEVRAQVERYRRAVAEGREALFAGGLAP